ncbi:MAG: hypothetical protein M1825_005494 [Sarcosagium campestre]|nr:MAG: hypothetical protein M1825_005494 [Sarcosagium campestre]
MPPDPGGLSTPDANPTIEALLAGIRSQSSAQSIDTATPAANMSTPRASSFGPAESPTSSGSHRPRQPYFTFSATSQPSGSRRVSVSPPRSPPLSEVQTHNASAIISPNAAHVPEFPTVNTGPAPPVDRTSNLLNLLKFSKPAQPLPSISHAQQEPITISSGPRLGNGRPEMSREQKSTQDRNTSASDLMASFMGKTAAASNRDPAPPLLQSSNKLDGVRGLADVSTSSASNSQELLLKLLNRPKQKNGRPTSPSVAKKSPPELGQSQPAVQDLTQTLAGTSLETSSSQSDDAAPSSKQPFFTFGQKRSAKKSQPQKDAPRGIFTYVNPFEQLAASSQRQRAPQAEASNSENRTVGTEVQNVPTSQPLADLSSENNKRKSKDTSPVPLHPSSRRKLVPAGSDAPLEASVATTSRVDGRTPVEALLGIGAPRKDNTETVSEALDDISGQVDQEAGRALANAEADLLRSVDEVIKDAKPGDAARVSEDVQDLAIDIKKELDKPQNQGALEETMPAPVAAAVKNVINDTARLPVADSWENAASDVRLEKPGNLRVVRTLVFPVKAFVSFTLKPFEGRLPAFREEFTMEISRFKKEFDQIDRSLVTASKDYIVYATPKNGGLRVIRQDDGRDKNIFNNAKDRFFDVTLSTAAPTSPVYGSEAVLGTGVSGAVYWTALGGPEGSFWDAEIGAASSLVFPPPASPEEGTSGGMLKTRARRSARHPEYFAIGRGKAIYLVWPGVASAARYLQGGKLRAVNTAKYLQERSLKIATGKAGKDFVFSEDDTILASLDKVGRLRFWDVRSLTDPAYGTLESASSPEITPVEVDTPVLTLMTTPTDDRAWPSSITFVDKLRPFARGHAARYVLVGMKQNHTIQLWDLALGKAVQELNFPHETEADALCSILYHAATAMIVVGHPTRNSVYFVHVSAPRYNLPAMSQARYLERLEQNDAALPKLDVTAIMSGVREISFASKGQLRSLHLAPQPQSSSGNGEGPALFELYAMHSRGVSCMTIKREDFGWNEENAPLHPVDAEARGLLTVEDLRQPSASSSSEASSAQNGDPAAAASTGKPTTQPTVKLATRETQRRSGAPTQMQTGADLGKGNPETASVSTPGANGVRDTATAAADKSEKTDKKKKTKRNGGDGSAAQAKDKTGPVSSAAGTASVSNDSADKESSRIEEPAAMDVSTAISSEFEKLYRRINEDKRTIIAAGDSRLEAVLRVVSSTLAENVDRSMGQMIDKAMTEVVLPCVSESTTSAVKDNLPQAVQERLDQTLPDAVRWAVQHPDFLRNALPEAVGWAVRQPDFVQGVSRQIANDVSSHVQREASNLFNANIIPAFREITIDTSARVAAEVESRIAEQLKVAEQQHQRDSQKIEALSDLVRGLTSTVSRMASSQADFQREILKMTRKPAPVQPRAEVSLATSSNQAQANKMQLARAPQAGQAAQASRPAQSVQRAAPTVQAAPRVPAGQPTRATLQQDLERVSTLMREHKIEDAAIHWIQSENAVALYDQYFVRFGPDLVESLSQLVLLSVVANITANFDNNLDERLDWVHSCFAALDPKDSDIGQVLPKVVDVLVTRLEGLYMQLSERDLQDPTLLRIPPLTRFAKALKNAA